MDRSLDLAIIGGTVVDGLGSKPFRADVGIINGVIAEIAEGLGDTAREVLRADGAVVAPGFVDAHGHSDYTLLVDGRAISQVSQGVTTEVIGNCGHGCEPLTDDLGRFTGNIYGYNDRVDLTWRSTGEYLERLERSRPAINVVPLTPAGNIRRASIDPTEAGDGLATENDRKQMLRLIGEAMAAGSNGISFGLEYRQEASASFEELVEQANAAGDLGGIVAVHTRNKDRRAVEAVEEAIAIARASGTPVQVSHILPRRTAGDRALEQIVSALSSARAEGLDLAFDVHTRTHGITNLSDCIAPDILGRGTSGIRAALADPGWASAVQAGDSIIHRFSGSGWDSVQVFSSSHTPELVGATIAEIAGQERCEPWEAIRRLLSATKGDVHDVMVVCDSYDEEDIVATASLPGCLAGSDATTLCPDGPLAGEKFLGAYTWAAWLYSKFTGPAGPLSMPEAIRKLAAEPAERFGLLDRGAVATGKKADLAIFDPKTFGTSASIAEPNILATGIRHVTVNGSVVFKDGEATENRPGQIIRRTQRSASS